MTPIQDLPAVVERLYATLNRFEVSYQRPPETNGVTEGSAAVFSNLGCGRANFSLRISS